MPASSAPRVLGRANKSTRGLRRREGEKTKRLKCLQRDAEDRRLRKVKNEEGDDLNNNNLVIIVVDGE